MPDKSTKKVVEIADIKDNIILLKDGSLRSLLEISAINFDLRSSEEQTAIIQAFQNFLNAVDFPLQLAVHSRRYSMDEYFAVVDEAANSTQNELLKIQAAEYSKFIKELLELSNIMSKKFFISLPFYVYEAPSKTGLFQSLKSIIKPSQVARQINPEQLETYKTQLQQRANLVYDGLVGLGLKVRPLERDELINLFYGIYNMTLEKKINQESVLP